MIRNWKGWFFKAVIGLPKRRSATALFRRRIEVDAYDCAKPARAGFESLGSDRRSVNEKAPLQNRFRERRSRRRPGIKFDRDAMELRGV